MFGRLLDFLPSAQNPYTPVCLMTSLTVGTEYYRRIDVFRRFRDGILLGRFGGAGVFATRLYYGLGAIVDQKTLGHERVREILRFITVKPLYWMVKNLFRL